MSQLVQLAVMTPHAVIPGDGEHHVDAGSTIAIECFIQQSAAAPQYIFWYHNSRMINYDKQRGGISVTIDTEPEVRSRLTITNARPSDSGNYTCVAANTRPASINVYITQVNKIAAIQSRAVGSSSRIAVIAYNLLWLPLAVVLTPTPSLAPDSSIRWLVTLVISHVFGAAARLVLACHITWRLPLILQLGEQNTNALGSVNMKYLNQKTDSARNNNLETVSI
ncbi:Immunoglobulin-like domain [Trinorchestia longiramus]|nr:Immunoglobulin-like domain [Trinorchestia longiramus]